MRDDVLAKTGPHGEHAIILVEDHAKPINRIYRLQDSQGRYLGILGSELESLCEWWAREGLRPGHQDPEDL